MIDIFEEKLAEMGKKHKNLVVFAGNFAKEVGLNSFYSAYGERFFNLGNGVANMIACASAFVVRGKMPVIVGYEKQILSEGMAAIFDNVDRLNLNVKFVLLSEEENWRDFAFKNVREILVEDSDDLLERIEEMLDVYGPVFLKIKAL